MSPFHHEFTFYWKVNSHDTTENQQGLYTFLYEWIILTDERSLRTLENSIGNITKVAVMYWRKSRRQVSNPYMRFNCGQIRNTKVSHVEAKFQWIHWKYRFQVTLESTLWKPQGRRFSVVGTFHRNDWYINGKVFPNKDYGLNGRSFIVSTNLVCSISVSKIFSWLIIIQWLDVPEDGLSNDWTSLSMDFPMTGRPWVWTFQWLDVPEYGLSLCCVITISLCLLI